MKRALLLALAAFSLLVLACGEDDPAPTEATSGPAEVSTTATVDATTGTGVTATEIATATAVSEPPTALAETPAPATPSEPVASTYFVATEALPRVRFVTGAGSVELPVEVPPRSEYAIGMSGRTELEDGRGMLFHREDFGQTGFWMKNTHVDLDIAFVDAAGEIVFVTTMLADTLDIHQPGAPYVAAIEVRAGWYAEHGVAAGDRVEYAFDLATTVTD